MLKIHLAKTHDSGNTRIIFIHHQGIVTRLPSHHFQLLPRSPSLPHSTWQQAHNQAPVQPKDIWVMGHHGKGMFSPKAVMVHLKCSPLSSSQNLLRHLQSHLECLQHRVITIQSLGRDLPPLQHQNNLPAHLRNPPLGVLRNNFNWRRIRAGQMSPGLLISPHWHIFPMTNTIQIMSATIRRTWAVRKATPQSSWCQRNCPWSNLPKGWGSPISVPSTDGRNNGWLGFWRRSIGPLSGDRNVWNHCELGPWNGRQWWQIFCRLSRLGCHWKISNMGNGFDDSGLRWLSRNVQARFGRQGKEYGEATSDWWRTGESVQEPKREVTYQSCQIQVSWL